MFNKHTLADLKIIAHLGAEVASASLTTMLNHRVSITIDNVAMTHIELIPEKVGGSDSHCVALVSRVTGDIEGNSSVMFIQHDAELLVELLGKQKRLLKEFGKLEHSILEETAHIMTSSFMNSITLHLGHPCEPQPPLYIEDLGGAILSNLLMESAEDSDQAILISTNFFCRDEDISANFIFLPNPKSLKVIKEGLEQCV